MNARPPGGAARALALVLLVAALAWAAILFGAVRQQPGWEGWVSGLFGGGFMALLIAAAGAWGVLFTLRRANRPAAGPPQLFLAEGELAQVLAELEEVRERTKQQIHAGALWRIPVCVVGVIALWVLGQTGDDPPDVFDLILFMGGAVLAGYAWAAWALSEAYRRLYKARVLPKIAADFGALTWRHAQPPLDEYRRHRLFPDWDSAHAEDEIHGEYRGLPLSIIELKLIRGSGKNRRTVFNGLAAAVTLPRGLSGTTVVVPDKGMFGNLAERMRGGPCQPVRLEDPVFEKAYEVYASDQISARALLTPAFMARFMALAESGRFGAPAALIQDNRLIMALAATHGRNLFEPPSYRKPAAGREALTQLHDDIEAVLRAADAVIDLDQAARLQPR
ncbi:DUF3137 domain-containing protein [Phenylobacterium sp. SCN 70-31]|uniref:DUF3137 domain-containing protein n=1 Tax=Phenylobacterium sp. SCN 70-31 TaxID=1660129 RepID=UPI00086A7E7F|nr:DUF3137 domain-containing protein [Phenylobacterium sp. SCN 70-31]ODT86430.1 MAG: hypothetical protein ABS78_16625 [Phenylobacterium sp. SCN 70-31]